jgi:hypothetical protein
VRKWVLGAALASGVLEKLVPRYGLVLQLDESGKPLPDPASAAVECYSMYTRI